MEEIPIEEFMNDFSPETKKRMRQEQIEAYAQETKDRPNDLEGVKKWHQKRLDAIEKEVDDRWERSRSR